jgi:arylsulfatase
VFSDSAALERRPTFHGLEGHVAHDAGLFGWAAEPLLEVGKKYKETVKKYPNPPAATLTKF